MLRDRCPEVVDLALKWCQAKTKWIDHVYSNFIGIYISKDERYEATRIVLGLQKKDRNFSFEKTIHWDSLTKEQFKEWTYVKGWVDWFTANHLDMQQYYKTNGREALIEQYLSTLDEDTQQELADYLIESFN